MQVGRPRDSHGIGFAVSSTLCVMRGRCRCHSADTARTALYALATILDPSLVQAHPDLVVTTFVVAPRNSDPHTPNHYFKGDGPPQQSVQALLWMDLPAAKGS